MRTSQWFFSNVANCICFKLPPTISQISFFSFLFFPAFLFCPSRRTLFPCARQKGPKINVQVLLFAFAFHAEAKTQMTSLLLLSYNKILKHNRVWCFFFFCCRSRRAQNWIKDKSRHVKAFAPNCQHIAGEGITGVTNGWECIRSTFLRRDKEAPTECWRSRLGLGGLAVCMYIISKLSQL